jgi:hypothetical protein
LAEPSRSDITRAAVPPPMNGRDEQLGVEIIVELERDVAGELDMLLLVLADGDVGRAINQHVGRLQHRVGEQADARALAVLARLVLELGHAIEPTHPRGALEDPGELGVCRDR